MKMRWSFAVILIVALAAALPAFAGKQTAFQRIADPYETIRLALYHDTLDGVADGARAIEKAATETAAKFSASKAGVAADKASDCQALLPKIAEASKALASAKDLAAAREAFYGLSKPMVQFREMVSGPRPMVVFCPMAKKSWLQPEGEIGNPYYGKKMAHCGTIVSK